MHSRLIGWDANSCLMLEQPTRAGKAVHLTKGLTVIGRGLHEGQVWGFRTNVLFQAIEPFRILFLSYPDQIEELSLRKSPRIQIKIDVIATLRKHEYEELKKDPQAPTGTIRNISLDGCSLSFPFPLEENMPVFISFELPNRKVMENILGFVRNVRKYSKENIYGIEFDAKLNNLEGLKEFISLARLIVSKAPSSKNDS